VVFGGVVWFVCGFWLVVGPSFLVPSFFAQVQTPIASAGVCSPCRHIGRDACGDEVWRESAAPPTSSGTSMCPGLLDRPRWRPSDGLTSPEPAQAD